MDKLGNARPILARVAAFFDSRREMAESLGKSYYTVNTWFSRGYIPADMAPMISMATGGKVSIEVLVLEASEAKKAALIERKVMKRLAARSQEGGQG